MVIASGKGQYIAEEVGKREEELFSTPCPLKLFEFKTIDTHYIII